MKREIALQNANLTLQYLLQYRPNDYVTTIFIPNKVNIHIFFPQATKDEVDKLIYALGHLILGNAELSKRYHRERNYWTVDIDWYID